LHLSGASLPNFFLLIGGEHCRLGFG
jgi:hypothetical protein